MGLLKKIVARLRPKPVGWAVTGECTRVVPPEINSPGAMKIFILDRPDGSQALFVEYVVLGNPGQGYYQWIRGQWVPRDSYGIDTEPSFEVK